MNNIKNKISQNKILTFIVVAFVLALSLYGCKTFIANAANNQEVESTENQEQVDVNNEQAANDEAPLEAYGYKDTTSEPGQTILVLTYDKDKVFHSNGGQTVYYIPKEDKLSLESWPWYADRESFTSVKINENLKNYSGFRDTSYMFNEFKNVNYHEGFEYLNTSNVKYMNDMFYAYGENSSRLDTPPDVSNWDMSKVEKMYSMFKYYGNCDALDTLPDVSKWDTSRVENVAGMFEGYGHGKVFSCINLTNWDTRNITDKGNYRTMLEDVRLKSIILGPNFDLDTSNWCGTCLRNRNNALQAWWVDSDNKKIFCNDVGKEKRTEPKIYFDTHQETYAYKDNISFDGQTTLVITRDDEKDWHKNGGQTVYELPQSASQPSDWQWNNDRASFTRVKIKDSFKYNNFLGFTSTAYMFSDFKNVVEGEGFEYINTTYVRNMSHMFDSYGSNSEYLSTVPNVSKWDTVNARDMSYMFNDYGLRSKFLKSLPDVSHWYTYNVTDVSYMFYRYGFYNTFENLNLNSFRFESGKDTKCEAMLRYLKLKSITLNWFFNYDISLVGHHGANLTNSEGKVRATWYDDEGNEYKECNFDPFGKKEYECKTFYDHNPKATNSITMSKHMITQQHAIDNAISQHSQNSSLIHHITHHVSKVAGVIKKVFH